MGKKKELIFEKNIGDLRSDLQRIESKGLKSRSDIKSYSTFINYFKNIKGDFDEKDIIIGSHFVYGWMPTILNLYYSEVDVGQVLKCFNKSRTDELLNEEELGCIKSFINNSLVGTSKILHFINPKKYAIWDSLVYKYLTKKSYVDDKFSECKNYLKYLDFCNNLVKEPDFHNLRTDVINLMPNHEMSDLRIIEFIMYERQRQENESNREANKIPES